MLKQKIINELRLYKIQEFGNFKSKKKLRYLLKEDLEKLLKFQILIDYYPLNFDCLRIIYDYLNINTTRLS